MANLFSEKPIIKVVMLKGQDGEEKLINQADGSDLSFWVGTQAEYDAIPEAELIENCVYYITDDTRENFNTRLNELDTKEDNNATAIIALEEALDDLDTKVDNNYESLLNKITYDTETHADYYTIGFRTVAGYITTNCKFITFTLDLPYIFGELTPSGVTSLKANIRHSGGGYVGGNAEYVEGGYQFINLDNLVTVSKVGDNTIRVSIQRDTAFAGTAVTNTPVCIELDELTFEVA